MSRSPGFGKFLDDIAELYDEYFEYSLNGDKSQQANVEMSTLVERLLDKSAGTNDILEIHMRCLENREDQNQLKENKTLALQGQFVAIELMGHLLDAYRKN